MYRIHKLGLAVAAQKTKAILFTSKRRFPYAEAYVGGGGTRKVTREDEISGNHTGQTNVF